MQRTCSVKSVSLICRDRNAEMCGSFANNPSSAVLSLEMRKGLFGNDSIGVALSECSVKAFGIGKYVAQMSLLPLGCRITLMAWEW